MCFRKETNIGNLTMAAILYRFYTTFAPCKDTFAIGLRRVIKNYPVVRTNPHVDELKTGFEGPSGRIVWENEWNNF